jgi:hypothetical protein
MIKHFIGALAGLTLSVAAIAAEPVVVQAYPTAKGAKYPTYTVDNAKKRLTFDELGRTLGAVAGDPARGRETPVAVLADSQLKLDDVNNVVGLIGSVGLTNVRYYALGKGSPMMSEFVPQASRAFGRDKLNEMLSAPRTK